MAELNNTPPEPIKIVVKEKPVQAENEVARGYDPRVVPPNDLPEEWAHFALFDFFDLKSDERVEENNVDKLRTIHRWAINHAQSQEIPNLLYALRRLETRMHMPPLGVSRLNHFYQFIRMDEMAENYEKERQQYLR